uniref:Reverse transcriptase domain-containing protein n=1 Tax=Tanacetum cinerariifolium TaxID=118510 RepID=A0A6L2NXJ0_TANCI|nr:reverse transcriptase domain-containing protein [Tanacetum cinerariifolium]
MVRPNGQAPRSMEELCQPSINGRGGPIASILIQAIDFGLRHHMIQQVQNTCQFHGLPGDDANRHIDKFFKITQHMKQNGVSDDALCLSLFPYSLKHHAIAWYDRLPRNSIYSFNDMMRKFLSKYFPPSMVWVHFPATPLLTQRVILKQSSPEVVFLMMDHLFLLLLLLFPMWWNGCSRNLHFNLNFADALLHMPKFALMFKSPLSNKEKLFDLATTPVNENCSAVILKKFLEKLGDPGKFLIPCDFLKLDESLALADQGVSINLMPLSIWRKLSLPELTSMQMILELADRSTTRPAGIAEDVFVKVGKFHFPTDFVVVDYVVDPRVPLILERPFLRTRQVLIDVYSEELTLRVDDQAITFKVGPTLKYSYNDAELINRIDVIDVASEEYVYEGGDFILEEIKACLTSKSIPLTIDDTDFDLEGGIRLLEELLNNDPSSSLLPSKELNVEEIKTVKSSIDEPPELELKELPSYFEYAFLEGTDKLPVIISKELKNEEKYALLKVLKSHKRMDFPDTFRYRLTQKTKKRLPSLALMERLPTDVCLLVYAMLHARSKDKMLKRYEDTNLVLNREKCHFMVKEGIVLGQKISKSRIEVDRAKVKVIAKLPHSTFVKEKTPFISSKEFIESFNTLKKKLIEAPILVAPDWDLPFEIMCDASDYVVGAVLGQRKTKHFQSIHYVSNTMTEAQAHYTTTEKELVAVVYAFEKF